MTTDNVWQPTSIPRGILLDIEGTTSSIEFVYQVMFPFARTRMLEFLQGNFNRDDVQAAIEQVARDAGHESSVAWLGPANELSYANRLSDHLLGLMDSDSKSTGLKAIQGLIWESGFRSGELQSHLYDDVYPALLRWSRHEIDLRIYSSGSVVAQKLFFGHTPLGDLRPFFKGFYDTTLGGKRDPSSYKAIVQEFNLPPSSIVFFSDNPAELTAANAAGITSIAVVRPGNPPLPKDYSGPQIKTFDKLYS